LRQAADVRALAGVFPVLCTPFDESGAPDLASLDRLVDATLDSGADGLVFGGIASEVMKLGDDERRTLAARVLRRVARRGGRRVPVWVGTGHQAGVPALALSLHAQEHGAAGVMVMPPFVQKPGLGALAAFFGELDAALSIPIMVQDAPLASGLTLPVGWLAKVAHDLRNVRAVKVEAPPTAIKVADLAAAAKTIRTRIALFGGLGGANFVAELRRGAAGTLPGAGFPDVFVRILERWRAGDEKAAQAEHERALPLIRFVSQSVEWSFHAYKRILVRRGVLACAHVRRPTCRFDDDARRELDLLCDASGITAAKRPRRREKA
jgi:4-hydroxy-tetrahydrodipicolinate synthase